MLARGTASRRIQQLGWPSSIEDKVSRCWNQHQRRLIPCILCILTITTASAGIRLQSFAIHSYLACHYHIFGCLRCIYLNFDGTCTNLRLDDAKLADIIHQVGNTTCNLPQPAVFSVPWRVLYALSTPASRVLQVLQWHLRLSLRRNPDIRRRDTNDHSVEH